MAADTDPAEKLMNQIWTAQRKNAVILVKTSGVGSFNLVNFGTAFMIDDGWAISAGHVVCAKDSPHLNFSFVELHIGGQGAPPTIIESPEANIVCYQSGADFALIRVPPLNEGRPHLVPGAFEDLRLNHFVTVYGYGGNQPGRPLKGNASFPVDAALRIRTDLNGVEADSGGPVLDQDGRVVGVLVAGNQSVTTAFVPLRELEDFLNEFSIVIPPGNAVRVDHYESEQPVDSSHIATVARITGSVSIALPRAPNGSWPVPPVRRAAAGEARVLVAFQTGRDHRAITSDTAQDGTWSLSPPGDLLTQSETELAVLPSALIDMDRPVAERTYLSDPSYVTTSSKPIVLNLYPRSVYVRDQFNLASASAQILQADPVWKACAALLQIPPPFGCTKL